MPYLRLVLAWMILFAVPLQGIAAGTMALCAGSAHQAGEATQATAAVLHAADPPHAVSDRAGRESGRVAHAFPDAEHECGACSSCCMAAAISAVPLVPDFAAAPQAEPQHAFAAMHPPAVLLPDKPPRT